MAKGTPDFFGHFTIPLVGNYNVISEDVDIETNLYVDLVNLTGKGFIYGGLVHIESTQELNGDIVRITVDGDVIGTESFNSLYRHGMWDNPILPVSLLQYELKQSMVTLLIGTNISFEETFVIDKSASNSTKRDVITKLWYAGF